MKEIALKRHILEKFKAAYPEWINSSEIEIYGINLRYKASHADRRMRDLFKEGYLEKRKNGVSVDYRYLPPKPLTPEEREAESLKILQASLM